MKLKILILFSIILVGYSCKNDKKKQIEVIQNETTNFKVSNGRFCYMSIIQSDVKTDTKTITEKDYINVDLKIENEQVTGKYTFTSHSGNINSGNFIGTIKDNIITSVYSADNGTTKEELVFKFNKNKLAILGGAKEISNGVNRFKDKSKGIYMMEIPKSNCN